jgi:plasmid maintenance system antidote protein VapI
VETGTLRAVASVEVPPNSAMISEVVMSETSVTENRKRLQERFPNRAIYRALVAEQTIEMISTGEILAELQKKLDAKTITKTQIAKVAGIGNNRVSELFGSGTGRRLLHDEAVKLVEGFGLERSEIQRLPPVSPRINRLVVQYIAAELGVSLEDHQEQLAEIAEDVRAFGELLLDPKYRDSPEMAETFFQAMRLRRPAPGRADPLGNDRH